MVEWLVLFGAAALTLAGAAGDGYPRRPDLDVLAYRYELALSDSSDEIRMAATVEFRFVAGGRADLGLDLVGARTDGRGMTVDDVRDATGTLSFTHRNDRLEIALRAPGAAGQLARVVVRYHGIPAAALKIGPNRHGDRTFASDNWPDLARNWLVGIDHPYDKAMSEFVVTAPAHYQVVSNGLLVEETDLAGGLRRTHWKQSVPIATWLQTIGVARFAVEHSAPAEGIPIQAWVYPQDRDQGFADFGGPTAAALRFYNERVGPYAYEKLANIESTAAGGGMEAATAIGYTERLIGTPRAREVIVHEIAHQWFGNTVTESDWDDVWLSEGFATYFTLLFTEHDAGRDAFVAGLERSRATVLAYDSAHPGYRVVHDGLRDMKQVTSSQTYQKGAWTLHMLRGIVGTETFWRGIREYHRRFRTATRPRTTFAG
ncbi:MAG: M1 family metallopeptidase [Gemmatimonadales bacterium]